MVRTPSCDKNGLKKGTWTAEEDRKLTAYVTRYGCWNWRQLPKFAGLSRCGKSCRLRWMNYLRPNIKRGNYSKEEEDTIIELHESMGNRWSVIAARLPGRTDNEIKNHWHTNLKKRVLEQQNSVPHEEKHSSNNLAPREKRQKRVKQQNNSLLNPTTSQIIDSSPSSSTGSSSISKDTAVATSTEAYDETSDSFWTQPFLTDCSFVSSDFLEQPFVDPEYISPVFDEIFCPYGLYEENIITSNNLSPTQNIIDGSPSSPQPSSSEFSSSSGNLWTQPFSADNSFIPNDFLEPFMDTEYLSPVFDEVLCPYEEGLN